MFHFIFCNICNQVCDIDHNYQEGYEKYICEDHGEVEGIMGETCLCIGCENFDETPPRFNDLDGYCDIYPSFPFKLFKRKKNCKKFEVRI